MPPGKCIGCCHSTLQDKDGSYCWEKGARVHAGAEGTHSPGSLGPALHQRELSDETPAAPRGPGGTCRPPGSPQPQPAVSAARLKRKDPQEKVSQGARWAGAGMQGRGCCPPLRKCKGAGGLCPARTPPHPGCLLSTRPECREGPSHQEAMSSPGHGAGAPRAPPRRAASPGGTVFAHPKGPLQPHGEVPARHGAP